MQKIKFLKRRYYEGKLYNVGDVITVPSKFARAYINCGAAAYHVPKKIVLPITRSTPVKTPVVVEEKPVILPELEVQSMTEVDTEGISDSVELENMTFLELKTFAKKLDLPAHGNKASLIARIKECQEV